MTFLPSEIHNNVLVGLDGHLFLYGGGQKSFAYSTGELMPSSQDILNLYQNLEQRKYYLDKRGIPFLHLIYPSKEIVLKVKVPTFWRDKIQSLYLSRFVAAQPELADMALYPLEYLLAIDRKGAVFRKLDTHMTDLGTMSVSQLVLEKFGLPYEVAEFFQTKQEKMPSDLADMLKLPHMDYEDVLQPKFNCHTYDNRSSLPGNTNNVCIVHHHNSITNKRLLIFGDSFVKYALPFFAPVFRDIVYVRSATFQSDMVDLMKPDFVISSNAERYLCKVESDSNSSPMLFRHYGKTNYAPPADFIKAYTAQFSWHHHRNVYESWSLSQLRRLCWGGLGICQPNRFIKTLDAEGKFRSTGPDPFFTFSNAGIKPGTRYSLQLELESDVQSNATVYFQTIDDNRYSQTQTVSHPVKRGSNNLIFLLPSKKLKSVLRLDPLACQGNFTIKNPVLKEVLDEAGSLTI